MTISFREIADQCDTFDKEVEDISNARKEFWAEIREVIPARDVKALKAAIKARRKLRADPEGERALEERVSEILEEIADLVGGGEVGMTLATRARAPREIWTVEGMKAAAASVIPHDEDGVLIEELGPEAAAVRSGLGETAPVSGDVGGDIDLLHLSRTCASASPNNSELTSDALLSGASDGRPTETETGDPGASEAAQAGTFLAGKSSEPSHNSDDPGELPAFLDRRRVA